MNHLLICYIGAGDGTNQRDGWSNIANHDPSDFDEGDIRSLSDRSYTSRSIAEDIELVSREIVESSQVPKVPGDIQPDRPMPVQEKEILSSPMKRSKKSKVAGKRAIFE